MLKTKSFTLLHLGRKLSTQVPYELTCGLEIHTKLNTKSKLFSRSTNDPFEYISKPNSHTSYFDIALPGTQPVLNYEAVLFATKLALSLKSEVNLNSQFDRKHYFYGDQPQGYQITQHYHPFSKGGHLSLSKEFDGIDQDSKEIKIIQLQIEQDTGRSLYLHQSEYNGKDETLIDFNRTNVPLIELVTEPDFHDIKQVKAFIKKFQNLVRQLKISTGDLESGSIRVDVNVSVNEHPRVELKNLPNTSSIIDAIRYEYDRQVNVLKNGLPVSGGRVETRGWNGDSTILLRSKESAVDYRYMADPELPLITLDADVLKQVKSTLTKSADEYIKELMAGPYFLTMKDAKILTIQNEFNDLYNNEELKRYYIEAFHIYENNNIQNGKVNPKNVVSWLLHEFLGDLKKLEIPLAKLSNSFLTPKKFAEFLTIMHNGDISNSSGKLLLFHILKEFKNAGYVANDELDYRSLIDKHDLAAAKEIDYQDLENGCRAVINEANNPKLIEGIKSGKKKNSIKYLVGLGMRKYQGKIGAEELETMFKHILEIE